MTANDAAPRGETRFGPEAVEVLVGVDEGLLGQVLRVGQRAGHPVAKRVNRALMCSNQFFKSAGVALLALDYPTLVLIRRDHALFFTGSDNPGRGIL